MSGSGAPGAAPVLSRVEFNLGGHRSPEISSTVSRGRSRRSAVTPPKNNIWAVTVVSGRVSNQNR